MREIDESIFVKPQPRETCRFLWKIVAKSGCGPAILAVKLAAAGMALGGLASCANPYVDSRREAGQRQPVGASTPDMVAICFSPTQTPREQVATLAQLECAKTGRVAAFDHEDPWSCRLLAPNRAFYRCSAKP